MGFEGNEITGYLLVWFSHIKGVLLREQLESSVAFSTDYVSAVIALLQALLVHFANNRR